VRENSRWNLHENFGARQDPASKDLIVEIRIPRGGKLRLTNFAELTNESTLRESGFALSLSLFVFCGPKIYIIHQTNPRGFGFMNDGDRAIKFE